MSDRTPRRRFTGIALGVLLLITAGCRHTPAPFYPIGIYGVRGTNAQAMVREAGFNVVAGSATREYLDSAHRLGLHVLAAPGTTAGTNFSPATAQATVRQFDQHPALWAWYLIDEPDLHAVSPADVQQAHTFIKSLGAQKPTALVLYQGGESGNYGRIADITMIDRYPIPWLPLANFPQHVRLARLGSGPDRPLIAVIQAFDWTSFPKLRPGSEHLRAPTAQELRCMTYCALARRANGLFYYCYDDGSWQAEAHPETWQAVKGIVAEVNQLAPLFQAKHVWWPFVQDYGSPGVGFNEALETAIIPALLRVNEGNGFVPAGTYLLAVNNTDRDLAYRVTLPPLLGESVEVLGEGRTAQMKGPWLEDKFGGYAVHIYGPLKVK